MALKYWEDLLLNLDVNIDRTEYNQMEVTRAVLDRNWTKDAINDSIATANKKRLKNKNPLLTPSANLIGRAVSVFHKAVAANRGKTTSMAGVDTKVPNNYVYPKRKRVPGGVKKSTPGRVFSASETEIVADNFGEISKVMADARKQTQDYLEKQLGATGELGLGNIHFAHGEGDSKSTLGALVAGQEALTKANSVDGQNKLKKQFKKDGVKLDNINLIKEAGIKGLRDFMTEDLQIKIGINEEETGDAAQFNDSFVVEGAMKMQDKVFARKYDAASTKKGQTLKGIQKTYFEAVQAALLKRWSKGDITSAEYSSSTPGNKRMKNIAARVVEKNFKKALKANKQFRVIEQTKKLTKKKAKTKKVDKNKRKAREKINTGIKASLGSSSRHRKTERPGTGPNPIALKELINAALPAELLQQMHPPALRNRTGRFRQSAEVTNVLVGPRGGVEAEYTYMRDPYETFEPGGNMGSRSRDPRRLIGGSVREIAMRLTGNKFIRTRRV